MCSLVYFCWSAYKQGGREDKSRSVDDRRKPDHWFKRGRLFRISVTKNTAKSFKNNFAWTVAIAHEFFERQCRWRYSEPNNQWTFVVNGSPTIVERGLSVVICLGTRSSRFIANLNAGRILLWPRMPHIRIATRSHFGPPSFQFTESGCTPKPLPVSKCTRFTQRRLPSGNSG